MSVCSESGCLGAAEMERVVCLHMYPYVRVDPHLCLLSSKKKKKMVRFIYMRHGACSPSEEIGCEGCQLYASSAVSVTADDSQ